MLKSNYYNQRRRKWSWKNTAFILAVLFIYFLGNVVFRPASGFLNLVFRPAWWVSEGLSIGTQTVGDFFRNKNKLAIENRHLQEENNKLRLTLLAKSQVESDNDYFHKLFGRSLVKANPVIGGVIFLPNFVPYQTLLMDIGKDNLTRQIKVGDLAVSYGTVLVGRVSEVGSKYSKVRLLSAEENLPVVIGEKNIPALAIGIGAGNFAITLPKDTKIVVGDRVTMPLLKNLLIGTVRYTEKNPNQPNQIVLVKTQVNLWQLKWLEIYDAKV